MRLVSPLFMLPAVILLLSACSVTYGNKEITEPEIVSKLQSGKSDKKEVLQNLGQPSDVRREGDKTEWVYRFREAKNNVIANIPLYGLNLMAGGKNGDVHTRKLYFDKNGRYLRGYYMQEECYTSNFFSLGRTISNGFVGKESQIRTKAEMDSLGKIFDADKSSENQLLERALE